jgi:hypothetical protein
MRPPAKRLTAAADAPHSPHDGKVHEFRNARARKQSPFGSERYDNQAITVRERGRNRPIRTGNRQRAGR